MNLKLLFKDKLNFFYELKKKEFILLDNLNGLLRNIFPVVSITACSCLGSWLVLETTNALPRLPTELCLLLPTGHHLVLVKSQRFS